MSNLYLALGDSISTGYGVGLNSSFPTLYCQALKASLPQLTYVNYGINGLTSGGCVSLICQDNRLRLLLGKASLITITIGSNDLLSNITKPSQSIPFATTLSGLGRNLVTLGSNLRDLNSTALVQIATIYNPLPAGPYASSSAQAQAIINSANSLLRQSAQCFGFMVVPLDQIFRGRERVLIGPDYVHPSLIGNQVIAANFSCAFDNFRVIMA